MNWLRNIGIILTALVAPLIIQAGSFMIVYSFFYEGTGPDDGANMFGFLVSIPTAIASALFIWPMTLVYLIKRIRGKN